MYITVKNVEIENKGKYNQAVVTYLDKGEEKTRNVVSFGDSKEAFDELKNAKEGDTFNIDLRKDGKYWNWVGANRTKDGGGVKVTGGGTQTYNRDFESKEERSKKQVYIVRQSSISAALEWWKVTGEKPTVDDVITVAKSFESYVFSTEEAPE
jgi:hypothetical protein